MDPSLWMGSATYPTLCESLGGVPAWPNPAQGNVLPPQADPYAGVYASAAGGVPGATGSPSGNALFNALRGVQAPAPPQAQRVATPHAPQERPIQGGEIVNLLASLGVTPQDVTKMPRLHLGR